MISSMLKRFRWIISGLIALFWLSSCRPTPPPPPPRAGVVFYQWFDDGGPGEVSVQINLRTQIATIKRGSREIGWCYVATGREGHGTPTGSFTISEKVVDKISNRWGTHRDEFGEIVNPSVRFDKPVPEGAKFVPAEMPYWMRLTDKGVGMHGGKIPNPGLPASAGCIRLPNDLAPMLYEVVDIGTPVRITR